MYERLLNGVARVLAGCITAVAIGVPVYAHERAGRASQERVAEQVRPSAARVHDGSTVPRLRRGTVAILAYHGIAPSPDSRYTVTPAEFDEQMGSLAEAGFTAISTRRLRDFIDGRSQSLPEKPVLITFDDGIKSVWIHGDPVFAKYGMRGVMFAITGDVGRHQPYYLNWSEVRAMQDTGRWDIESHSRNGHSDVQIDRTGGTGPFLTNRSWKDDAGRLETSEEWRRRIVADLDGSITDLRDHDLPRPVMLAYPFSASRFPTNDTGVPPLLRRIVAERFDLAVDNVDRLTLASRASDRHNMPRIEVFRGTRGRELLAKLGAAVATR